MSCGGQSKVWVVEGKFYIGGRAILSIAPSRRSATVCLPKLPKNTYYKKMCWISYSITKLRWLLALKFNPDILFDIQTSGCAFTMSIRVINPQQIAAIRSNKMHYPTCSVSYQQHELIECIVDKRHHVSFCMKCF